MPGGDRKGPLGEGAKTGRGLGYCTGHEDPGWTAGRGFGRGRGRGRGHGWGRGFRAERRGWDADDVERDDAPRLTERLERIERALARLVGQRKDG